MSNYTQTTSFGPKDTLPITDPNKTIYGAAYDVEFANIATAIATKYDSSTTNITLSGTLTAFTVNSGVFNVSAISTVSATVGAYNLSVLNYSDTGNAAVFAASNIVGYLQVTIQNTNTGTNASADFIVANSASTASTGYGDFGINSTGFTGTGSLGAASYVYLYSANTDLAIGTSTANNIRFVANSRATDAMIINSNNAVTINSPTNGVALTVSQASVASTSALTLIGNATAGGIVAQISNVAATSAYVEFGANGNALGGANTAYVGQDSGGVLALNNRGAAGAYIATSGTQRLVVSSGGAVTINAPTSGTTLTVTGTAAGTSAIILNTCATTGAQTASFSATNKPGAAAQTTPTSWIPIQLDGTTKYIPAFS
jgi:hypothetical protein